MIELVPLYAIRLWNVLELPVFLVEHIFNKMGVIHPIRHDGHDICEQTNQEVLSKFNVKTSANILNCRSNLEIQRQSQTW